MSILLLRMWHFTHQYRIGTIQGTLNTSKPLYIPIQNPTQPWGILGGCKIDNKAFLKPTISTDRALYPRVDTSPLAILVFNLEGPSVRGLPQQQVINQLEGCFVEDHETNLVVHMFEFAIDCFSVEDWTKQLDHVVTELERWAFRLIGIGPVLIFICCRS